MIGRGLAIGMKLPEPCCQPHPLELPPVVLSWMFDSLARLLGHCHILLRLTDVYSWRDAQWNPALPGTGLEVEIWVLVPASTFTWL